MSNFRIISLIVLVSIVIPTVSLAGFYSGRSVGMGNAYTTAARGVESVFWNPANLGFSRSSEKHLMLLSVGLNVSNNSFNLEQYNQYNGTFLSAEDKQTILDLIPAKGFNGSLSADVMALGASWYNFAFTISGRGTSDLLLPKDPIQALFFGNEINDTIIVSGSDGAAFASVDFGLSYGRTILKNNNKELLVGTSVRLTRGLVYQEMKEAQGEIFTLETGVNGEGNFLIQSAEGGKGYGVDLGISLKYKENWLFGLSFIDLISRMKWDKGTEEKGYQVTVDSLLAENFDTDSLVLDKSYTRSIVPFTTHMPVLLQAGVSYQLKRTLLIFDLKNSLTRGMGESKKFSASLGMEYRLSRWFNVRCGISLGKNEGITIAQGLGINLGVYHLDIGMANQKGVWFTKSKGVCLAISNEIQF